MTESVLDEVKKLIEENGNLHKQFKSAVEEKFKELEKKGAADPLITEKIEKMNNRLTDIDNTKTRLEKIEMALKRTSTASPIRIKNADGEEVDAPEDWVEAKQSFGQFLRKGANASRANGGDAWTYDKKTLSVQSDPDGGFLVTADMSGRVVKRVFESSPIRNVASVQVIGSEALEGIYDDNEASAGWVSEQGTRSQTNTPAVGKWRIPIHEIYAMPAATQRFLDDASIPVEQWLSGKIAEKLARIENAAFCTGTGVGQPRGFLTYTAGTTLRTTVQQVGSGSSGAVVADKLLDTVYALKSQYRARAQWAMNRSLIGKVRQLKGTQNDHYMWEPSLKLGEPATLLGYPIQEFNDMPDAGANSLSIAFADWAEFYQIVDRVGLRVLRDPYTSKGFVLFYSTKRVGGDVLNTEAGIINKLG